MVNFFSAMLTKEDLGQIEEIFDRKFDEKIDQKFDERFAEQNEMIQATFEAHDQQFGSIDARFDAVDRRFEAVDRRFDALTKEMRDGFLSVNRQFSRMFDMMGDFIGKEKNLEKRVVHLEQVCRIA